MDYQDRVNIVFVYNVAQAGFCLLSLVCDHVVCNLSQHMVSVHGRNEGTVAEGNYSAVAWWL